MKLLFIGDVVGAKGRAFLKSTLWALRRETGVDVVIANGENSADNNGVTPQSADELFEAGVDIITGGNHSFQRREIYTYLAEKEYILRPANYPSGAPGKGMCIYNTGKSDIAVISLSGIVFLDALDCPFRVADTLLKEAALKTKIIVIDFHAEATSEKRAFAEYVKGRASAVLGTHTHVMTSDAQVLGGVTGFITDVGMTGPTDSIIGVGKEEVIKKFLTKMPVRFKEGEGIAKINAALLDIDEATGNCIRIETIIK
ncbi:MAG: TIGR00282 family metallophosphoesterase [Bacillota bacterium]|nr:TIGR00282 family metallophosphoesterase [Bacillota bacterium]